MSLVKDNISAVSKHDSKVFIGGRLMANLMVETLNNAICGIAQP
jgi:hypothetical protein